MSNRQFRRARVKRRLAEPPLEAPPQSRWGRWLNRQPPAFFLLAAIAAAGLIIAFVLWLDERTLALVACVAFAGLLGLWIRTVSREWRDAELTERIISVGGCLILLGSLAASLVRFLAT